MLLVGLLGLFVDQFPRLFLLPLVLPHGEFMGRQMIRLPLSSGGVMGMRCRIVLLGSTMLPFPTISVIRHAIPLSFLLQPQTCSRKLSMRPDLLWAAADSA